MKVKLLSGRASHGVSHSSGAVIEVSPAEGKSLIEQGRAEPVAEKPVQRAETRKRKSAAKKKG